MQFEGKDYVGMVVEEMIPYFTSTFHGQRQEGFIRFFDKMQNTLGPEAVVFALLTILEDQYRLQARSANEDVREYWKTVALFYQHTFLKKDGQ